MKRLSWFKLLIFSTVLFALTLFIINPGYFDRIYAAFYNKYSESCSYCDVDNHGIKFCPQKAVADGAEGRWIIPDVGVNVACFEPVTDAQPITDKKDSAALIARGNTTIIADHNYQGFDAIKKCKEGTLAYMHTGDAVKEFVCTDVVEGYNAGTHLTDLDGNIVEFESGYTNYTCHFFSDRITIVHFAPLKEQL